MGLRSTQETAGLCHGIARHSTYGLDQEAVATEAQGWELEPF